MSKRNKIIYWIATVWLALGMVSTGAVQLLRMPEEVENLGKLGYPPYFLTILGTWKVLGVVAILIPRTPLLKEWAYAGFFFAMSGATISRIAVGDPLSEVIPSVLLLALTMLSWYFRPADRKLVPIAQTRTA
jgi:hypothetical protein